MKLQQYKKEIKAYIFILLFIHFQRIFKTSSFNAKYIFIVFNNYIFLSYNIFKKIEKGSIRFDNFIAHFLALIRVLNFFY